MLLCDSKFCKTLIFESVKFEGIISRIFRLEQLPCLKELLSILVWKRNLEKHWPVKVWRLGRLSPYNSSWSSYSSCGGYCLFLLNWKISKSTDLQNFKVSVHYLHNISVETVFLVMLAVACSCLTGKLARTLICKSLKFWSIIAITFSHNSCCGCSSCYLFWFRRKTRKNS